MSEKKSQSQIVQHLSATRRSVTPKAFFLIFVLSVAFFWKVGHVFSDSPETIPSSTTQTSAVIVTDETTTNDDSDFPAATQITGGRTTSPASHDYFYAMQKQTVFAGTAPNRINLDGTLSQIESLKGGPIELFVDLNTKKDVVDVDVEGNELVFHYGKVGKSELTIRAVNKTTGKYVFTKMAVEVWMPDYWQMVFTVIGGLGIFLLGMKYLSEGLQVVAGSGLRTMIATFTEHRLLAVTVGMVATMLIQSSSVTTVMVVGFINSQIMTLTQGIGVIMGANIGTTITAWILTINIGKYGLPIMGVCALVYMFSKADRTKYTSMAIMGLGAVFFGLELMTQGFAILKDLPEFSRWMEAFSADTTLGVIKCAAVGCLLTLIVQSSSATVGITMSLATIGIIEFPTAAALVLGENVGTTITAVLASIGTSTNARRAAAFHVIFNLIGVCWVTVIFLKFFLPMVIWIVGTNDAGQISNVNTGIATTHTMFNTLNMFLFFPFAKVAANFLIRVIPDREVSSKKPTLTSLHTRMMETSAISIERSRIEVLRMSNGCLELSGWVKETMQAETVDQDIVDKAFIQEQVLDTLQDEVIEFMADLLAGNLSHDIAETARGQLRMADELESISDYLVTIMKSHLKLRESNLMFPESEQNDIFELHDAVIAYMLMIHRAYSMRKAGIELLTEVHAQGRNITHRAKSLRDRFLKHMSEERFDPQLIMAFNAQLNAYRRVREHAQNVAEAIVGVK